MRKREPDMTPIDIPTLAARSLAGEILPDAECLAILEDQPGNLLSLLDAAFQVRRQHWGQRVRLHVLNNIQNGHCPEDCNYCGQAKTADHHDIADYPVKGDDEILAEAKRAYESGAFRYCMVSAGRGPSDKRIEKLAGLIRRIKENYPLQVCVSPGLLKEGQAEVLQRAGLDRLNHNLNTSETNYPSICSTHTYEDRLLTLERASRAGLEVCSGMIVGMGERARGVVEVLKSLRRVGAKSIPINYLMALPGADAAVQREELTPQYGLRILCLARLLNPTAEIRAAAGREMHLRDMQVLALYPANSIFVNGYLNVKGEVQDKTLRMISDAGFEIEQVEGSDLPDSANVVAPSVELKSRADLRPALK